MKGTSMIAIGSKVQRRSGSRATGTVLEVRGDRVQVKWIAGKRFNGADWETTTWLDASAVKPAGEQSAHAAWCKEQGRVLKALVAQAIAGTGHGTAHLYAEMNLTAEESYDMHPMCCGVVRSKEKYQTAIERVQKHLEARKL